jgi:hypothetical protein
MHKIPGKFKDKYHGGGMDPYDVAWLAPEMVLRLGDTEPTVSALAKRMNLWSSQVVKIALANPRTFEIVKRSHADHIRIRTTPLE